MWGVHCRRLQRRSGWKCPGGREGTGVCARDECKRRKGGAAARESELSERHSVATTRDARNARSADLGRISYCTPLRRRQGRLLGNRMSRGGWRRDDCRRPPRASPRPPVPPFITRLLLREPPGNRHANRRVTCPATMEDDDGAHLYNAAKHESSDHATKPPKQSSSSKTGGHHRGSGAAWSLLTRRRRSAKEGGRCGAMRGLDSARPPEKNASLTQTDEALVDASDHSFALRPSARARAEQAPPPHDELAAAAEDVMSRATLPRLIATASRPCVSLSFSLLLRVRGKTVPRQMHKERAGRGERRNPLVGRQSLRVA